MLDVVPVETDLFQLIELHSILDNRNEYWHDGWEFRLSREPIHYEWMELPENSDVWEKLYFNKEVSAIW